MRGQMPFTATVIDSLRAEFGVTEINAQIRKGMKGGTEFFASENGQVMGKRLDRAGVQPAIVRAVVVGKVARGR